MKEMMIENQINRKGERNSSEIGIKIIYKYSSIFL